MLPEKESPAFRRGENVKSLEARAKQFGWVARKRQVRDG